MINIILNIYIYDMIEILANIHCVNIKIQKYITIYVIYL